MANEHDQDKQWYILSEEGQQRGPLTTQQVQHEVKSGRMGPQSVLRPAEAAEDGWDYLFSYMQFRDAMPKPVVAKQSPAPNSQKNLFKTPDHMELKVILHDNIRVIEGRVEMLNQKTLVVCDLARRSFEIDAKLFVHLYDIKNNQSVNLWAKVDRLEVHKMVLSFTGLPLSVMTKYQSILDSFELHKAA